MILASGCVVYRDDEVLLMHRVNCPKFNDVWSNPGGKIKRGEIAEAAAIRETREELGIGVKIIIPLGTYLDYERDTVAGRFHGFLAELAEGTPTIREPEKCDGLEWFPFRRIPSHVAPYTMKYLDELVHHLAQHRRT